MKSLIRVFLRGLAIGLGFGLARILLRHPIALVVVISVLYFTFREDSSNFEFTNTATHMQRIGKKVWKGANNFYSEVSAAN